MMELRLRIKGMLPFALILLFANCLTLNVAYAGEDPSATEPTPEISFFSKDYFKLLYEDTKFVLTAPARWEKKEWVTFSLATLGVATVALLDKPVWDTAKRNQTNSRDDTADAIQTIGGGYSLVVPVTFYIAGEISDNNKAKAVALDGLAASMIASGIIHPALKFVAGRSPPKDEEGTYDFSPFSFTLPQSFPSGHATQSFALASVISSHYPDPWIKITAYGVASVASLARVYQGDHFLSDWTAGAIIGTVVGNTIVRFNEKRRKEKKEESVLLTPLLGHGVVGLNLTLRTE
jgi:membrane-associated phospholipid phosphatase